MPVRDLISHAGALYNMDSLMDLSLQPFAHLLIISKTSADSLLNDCASPRQAFSFRFALTKRISNDSYKYFRIISRDSYSSHSYTFPPSCGQRVVVAYKPSCLRKAMGSLQRQELKNCTLTRFRGRWCPSRSSKDCKSSVKLRRRSKKELLQRLRSHRRRSQPKKWS